MTRQDPGAPGCSLTLRPELEGRYFLLIEFLVARMNESWTNADDADRQEMTDFLPALEEYQEVAVRLLTRTGSVREYMPRVVECARPARAFAKRWSSHPDYDKGWSKERSGHDKAAEASRHLSTRPPLRRPAAVF